MRKIIVFTLLLAIWAGCKKDETNQGEIDEQIILDYLAEHNITDAKRDDTGLYYKIINQGTGQMSPYATVSVLYKGYLVDGTVFDQSGGEVYTERLTGLIAGWQIGIPKVGKGGKIQLFVPSELGYGSRAIGAIPANSVLIFEVEVLNF